EQRLGRHARPERARAAEQLALDDRDRLSASPRLGECGLAGGSRPDDHEVEAICLGHQFGRAAATAWMARPNALAVSSPRTTNVTRRSSESGCATSQSRTAPTATGAAFSTG